MKWIWNNFANFASFFIHLQSEVNAIKWDPSGSLLASCSDDLSAKVITRAKWQKIFTVHTGYSAGNNSWSFNIIFPKSLNVGQVLYYAHPGVVEIIFVEKPCRSNWASDVQFVLVLYILYLRQLSSTISNLALVTCHFLSSVGNLVISREVGPPLFPLPFIFQKKKKYKAKRAKKVFQSLTFSLWPHPPPPRNPPSHIHPGLPLTMNSESTTGHYLYAPDKDRELKPSVTD